MATPTITGTIWLVTVRYTTSGQQLMNTFLYEQDGDAADYAVLATQLNARLTIGTNWLLRLLDCFSANVMVDSIVYQPIAPQRLVALLFAVGTPGTQVGLPAPPNVSTVIERRGVKANRHNVGSIHLPPPAADKIVNGSITGGQLAAMDAFAGQYNQLVTPAGTTVKFAPILRDRAGTTAPNPVTIVISQTTARVMRRRTVGLGK